MQILEPDMMKTLIKAMRPKQWAKNMIIFGPLVFSLNLFDFHKLLLALGAFVAFCAISGSVYLLNDLVDIERDRAHPTKKHRPLASGALPVPIAQMGIAFFSLGSLFLSYLLDTGLFWVVLIYAANNLLYSFYTKHIVLLDIGAIAFGFVLRVLGGTAVLDVHPSPWLIMCTILLAAFLGFAKRRHELVLLQEEQASHRKVLIEYSEHLLDQMIMIVSASTVMSYALYTMSPQTVAHFGTTALIYTVPFVLYGIFRYLYLVHQKQEGGSPTNILFTDKALIADIVLWLIACVSVVYWK